MAFHFRDDQALEVYVELLNASMRAIDTLSERVTLVQNEVDELRSALARVEAGPAVTWPAPHLRLLMAWLSALDRRLPGCHWLLFGLWHICLRQALKDAPDVP